MPRRKKTNNENSNKTKINVKILTFVKSNVYLVSFKTEQQNIRIISDVNRLIGLVGRVFANGPGDLGSIPGRVIPKTLKMVLDTSLLNTQQYTVRIKSKVE